MQLGAEHVRVEVPATSANLGPGFDSLGMALGHRDVVVVRALGSHDVRVAVTGEGAGEVPDDERHLVVRALHAALDHVGAPRTGLRLDCENRIPHGRGMGSSAGAVVAGILAARGLIADPSALDDATVLELATRFEGHPDNAAPAILGGATIAWAGSDSRAMAARLDVHPDVEPVLLVPNFQVATRTARGALPASVPHRDAAFNAGRAALLVHALTTDPGLLFDATEDRLHQRYRAEVLIESSELVAALRDRGLPAVISGAGPTVLVLARRSEGDRVGEVIAALPGVAASWRLLRPGIDLAGARVERL